MLPKLWNENKVPLLTYLQQVHRGVLGLIRDQNEIPVSNAEIKILGRDIAFRSSKKGEYWRILLPGDYVIQVEANGFVPIQRQFSVVENKTTKLNLYMYPIREFSVALYQKMNHNSDLDSHNAFNSIFVNLKLLLFSIFVYFLV